jgi:hypothetical protein
MHGSDSHKILPPWALQIITIAQFFATKNPTTTGGYPLYTQWVSHGEKKKKKKEKTAGFLFCKAHRLFTPGDMLSRYTKIIKKPACPSKCKKRLDLGYPQFHALVHRNSESTVIVSNFSQKQTI